MEDDSKPAKKYYDHHDYEYKERERERIGERAIERLIEKGLLTRDSVSKPKPVPPVNDDNAKVAKFNEDAATQLRLDIRDAGEGGWKSQWYLGPSSDIRGPVDTGDAYWRWRSARDEWTWTGDTAHLQKMTDAVDFTCPPEASSVKPPAKPVARKSSAQLAARRYLVISALFIAAYTVATIISIFL
jgi:hypothetical protein